VGALMRILIALGGNALLDRRDQPDAAIQVRNVRAAAALIAPLTRDHAVIVSHGNGPQVGLLASESDVDPRLTTPYPLDALDAQTQGMLGYWIQRELANAGCVRTIATLVTQTVVAADDPAFSRPTKFIGPTYDEATAQKLAKARGWIVAADGSRWRRVVASPEPLDVVELPAARTLIESGAVVICGGGGGAAITRGPDGLQGREAVVDKDLVCALIAERLGVELLILVTDVAGILTHYGTSEQQVLRTVTPLQLRAISLPEGSMGPKAEAVGRFVERTGHRAAIGALSDLPAIVAGTEGTQVNPDVPVRGMTREVDLRAGPHLQRPQHDTPPAHRDPSSTPTSRISDPNHPTRTEVSP
jgi:carbamate kinase